MNAQALRLLLASLAVIGAATVALIVSAQSADSVAVVKVATFDVDATSPLGSPMAYDPVKRLDELILRCRGIVLSGMDKPIVLYALDWIGIANQGHDAFREELAEAAGTTPDRVAVHALHQHDAPGYDFTAERLMRELGTGYWQTVFSVIIEPESRQMHVSQGTPWDHAYEAYRLNGVF